MLAFGRTLIYVVEVEVEVEIIGIPMCYVAQKAPVWAAHNPL